MKSRLGRLSLVAFALSIGTARAQQYIATDLNATNATPTNLAPATISAVASPYQVGSGTANGLPIALSWNGTAASALNLTPAGYRAAAMCGISTNSSAVGYGVTSTGQTQALVWPGPVPSALNINPVINGTNAAFSQAFGISGNQIVGEAGASATNGYFAVLWPVAGTNVTNLNPNGYIASSAVATDGRQEAGNAITTNGLAHAMIWTGGPASAQDLNPAGFTVSFATGVAPQVGSTNSVAVGFAEISANTNTARAYIWPSNGTTNFPSSIHPAGYNASFANGISSTNVVGYGVSTNGVQVALLWQSLSSNAVVNLSTSLPSGATNAAATSIDSSGNIGGYAVIGGQRHAILWQPAAPPVITSAAVNTSTTVGIPLPSTFNVKATGIPSPAFFLSNTPPGIALAPTGTFSGAPATPGIYNCTITATNGVSPNAQQNFALTVNPTPVQSYAVLHSFYNINTPTEGSQPNAGLVQGSDGNFYGMTPFGGTGPNISGYSETGSGTIFRISPEGTYTILHDFSDGSVPNDGAMPGSALIQGTDGNFYGTTEAGGVYGTGTIFKMTPQGIITLLHSFNSNATPHDGTVPLATLLQASDGNLYGTTFYGGTALNGGIGGANGTLFRISTSGAYTILHNFNDGSVTNDGTQPATALIQASDGNLYGTTDTGGSAGVGTLYQMTLQGAYTLVRSFGDGSYTNDPKRPSALVEGTDHNFYATAYGSSTNSGEIAFKMTPQGVPTILHVFGDGSVANDGASSGSLPTAGLIQATNGNFYGTTVWGGQPPINGYGVAFQMTPAGAVSTVHVFANGTVFADGASPSAPLCQGFDRNLYGTTMNGGTSGGGSLFQLFLTNGMANPVALENAAPLSLNASAPVNFTFTAQGSPAPTFSFTGNLPPGLSLSSSGVLSGTPTQSGTYTFTIFASNGTGTPVSQTVTLTVQAPATDTPTLPTWGLILLATFLVIAATRVRPTTA